MYVTNIVNDLKKKKEELHGDVDSELYRLDPEFYMLCKLFSEKTGKNVDYKKYTDDCKQNKGIENMVGEDKKIDYIRSVHYGYFSKNGKIEKNGLIYCGRTFVPKNCLVYLRCGLVSGLPCKDCIKRLKKELNDVYGKDGKDEKVEVLSLFEICKEEINERDDLGRAFLGKYRNGGKDDANAKKYTSLLRRAGWVPSIKNFLLGGIQCDRCSTRYYSQYMHFLCKREGICVGGLNDSVKFFTAKICAKCAVNFMCDNNMGIKGIAEVDFTKGNPTKDEGKGKDGNENKKYETRIGYKNSKYI